MSKAATTSSRTTAAPSASWLPKTSGRIGRSKAVKRLWRTRHSACGAEAGLTRSVATDAAFLNPTRQLKENWELRPSRKANEGVKSRKIVTIQAVILSAAKNP